MSEIRFLLRLDAKHLLSKYQKQAQDLSVQTPLTLDRVSVPLPIAIDFLMDTMARDRLPIYLFSV